MTFPYYFHVFGIPVHPHFACELAAYALGFSLHLALRRKLPAPPVEPVARLWLIAGLVMGALAGAHVVAMFDAPEATSWLGALMGKSIVGAILGGWIGTEIVKRLNGIRHSTGDTWAIPLLTAMALGRVGCFLTGLSDHTHGLPAALPWAVDFGDGIPRHPTQLYESAFCLALVPLMGIFLALLARRPGSTFRLFVASYMLFRFGMEFLKPTPKVFLGVSILQIIALAAAAYAVIDLLRLPAAARLPVDAETAMTRKPG